MVGWLATTNIPLPLPRPPPLLASRPSASSSVSFLLPVHPLAQAFTVSNECRRDKPEVGLDSQQVSYRTLPTDATVTEKEKVERRRGGREGERVGLAATFSGLHPRRELPCGSGISPW